MASSHAAAITYRDFFSAHQSQLVSSAVPEYFWQSLYAKLKHTVFDAGDVFQIIEAEAFRTENGVPAEWLPAKCWKVIVTCEDGLDHRDPNRIFLVDHAWTYRANSARRDLQGLPNLLQRMARLMDINDDDETALIDKVLDEMWRYNQTYSVRAPGFDIETTMPIWYIMDEFGSRIQHSDSPTFRLVPFYDSFSQMAFSLLFPIKSVECGGEVTRDFIEGPDGSDPLMRKVLKLPWSPCDMTDVDYRCEEAGASFFMSFRQNETLPCSVEARTVAHVNSENPLKVYSDYEPLNENLVDLRFEIVSDEREADILWLTSHFKDFRQFSELHPHKFINQFPYECVLTTKDLLSAVCRRISKDSSCPKWIPITYNLKTELPQFVSLFQHRQMRNLDNHWICKPWNLARGLDIHITNNLNSIVRLSASGPKLACKYIEDPVLFYRGDVGGHVKFDIRYIVLLKSVEPLVVGVYKRFWIRFANKLYSLDCLDDYEKHFTVMNYRKTEIKQMYCHDFIESFEEQYPDVRFKDVEKSIYDMIGELFRAATLVPAPCGIAPSNQSRAIYGVDLMLKWDTHIAGARQVRPILLEVNWAPDCKRACQYYQDFFDDIFCVLFLGEENVNVQQV